MPAERAREPQEEEEDGYEPPFSSAVAGRRSAASSVRTSAARELEEPEASPLGSGLPGAAVMIGTHFHSLDEKGRVIIPAKMRAALTGQFWMMLDENDNIGLYPYATGEDILKHCEMMMAEDPENEEIAAAVLRITAAADLVTVESAFRVPVPDILLYRAGLIKEVVTVGALNHAVLWAREKWEEAHVSQPLSIEVRRAQASLMRAAASGSKRGSQDEAARQAERAEQAAREQALERAHERGLEREAERAGAGNGGIGVGRGERSGGRKAASSGDGGRGSGILKISDLGR